MRSLIIFAVLAGCGGKDTADTGTTPALRCSDAAMKTGSGEVDSCDLAACDACVAECGGDCSVAMSYPVQYGCPGAGSWSVYDFCPDWQPNNSLLCDDVASTIPLADPSPLGFSGADVLAAIPSPMQVDAEWVAEEGRPDTTVTLGITGTGDPVFHDREPADTTLGDAECPDVLEVPVQLTFSTADGAFDETFSTALWVMEIGSISTGAALDWQALTGSFAFDTIDPAEWDSVSLDLTTMLVPDVNGQVQVSASRELGTGMGEGLVGPLVRWPPLQ